MIRLYQYMPAFGLPNASPFCMKVETYLRMAGLEYRCVNGANPLKAPKGKLPSIDDDEKNGGMRVADSTFIIDYLKKTYGDKLDTHLDARQRAAALAMQRLFEENLYWTAVYARWIEDAGFEMIKQAFFAHLPLPAKLIVPWFARRAVKRELHGHGIGRHSRDEIYAIGCRDLTAAADFLGSNHYFMGDAPTTLDATAYAFLANLLWAPFDSPLLTHARRFDNLEQYCRRMKARFYVV